MVENKDAKKQQVGQPAVDSNSKSDVKTIITQNTGTAQAPSIANNVVTPTVKSKKTKGRVVSNESKVRTLALKFYAEQLAFGFDFFKKRLMEFDTKQYQIMGIIHNKDEVTDGIWAIATEKPHIHVIFRCVDRKKSIRVKQILGALGVKFRRGLDDELWLNRGVETVGNFAAYANYLTHETQEAIDDNKHIYDVSEIFSNLDEDGVKQVREGYTRIVKDDIRVTTSDLIALDEKAYELGLSVGNFDEWYNALPFILRANAKMKTIKERYTAGVAERVKNKIEVVRTCIFIQGAPNTGKTYASEMAIPSKDILTVRGGGSGKFDSLRPDHGGILIDDDVCPNLLNMTDNYTCYTYRRQSNNSVWSGDYFVVTSNKSFEEWLEDCNLNIYNHYSPSGRKQGGYNAHYYAMKSRFFICSVDEKDGINQLKLESPSTRGTVEEQKQRVDKFVKFRNKFNETIKTYQPKNDSFDYSDILGFGS